MALIMLVTLYTSRVVLQVLGVEDFGIYSVVGGVVIFLSFLNNSLSVTTQRFLNFEMGKKNTENLSKVFSIALTSHCIIALIVFIIAETLGLWFVKTHLIIPANRIQAVLWVYQFSILTTIINIISIPYDAAIIANERMKIYAYISIGEVMLKLSMIYLLSYISFDKLELYAILLFLISIIVRMIYAYYCKCNFTWSRYKFIWDTSLVKKMLNFSGWTVLGAGSQMLSNQGINILINIFFNPVHNASRAIALQVYSAIHTFSANFMIAIRPQIVKSFAQKEYGYVYHLAFSAVKYSYYLLFIISLPILFKTEYILNLWLVEVPEYAVLFTRLTIIDVLITATLSPLAAISQASGKIRNYQLIISICYALSFIITAILYKLKFDSYVAFIAVAAMSAIGLIARAIELKYAVGFPFRRFFVEVIFRIITVTIVSLLFSVCIYKIFLMDNMSMGYFIGTVLLTIISNVIAIWLIGLSFKEKRIVTLKLHDLKIKIIKIIKILK
jgi:O-antigen/teichoic acid export membrane protein